MSAPRHHWTSITDERSAKATGVGQAQVNTAAGGSQLPRKRLLQQMSEATGVRLILLRAAAGFGKTTLLQQYQEACRANGRSCVWLNMETTDNDPQRFARRLLQALAALPDLKVNPPSDADACLKQELLEQLAALSAPLVVLLDEMEVVHAPAMLDFLQRMLEELPLGAMLVMASRATPVIGLGRLRARGHLLEIKPADLRCTLEEAAEFLRDKRQLNLRDQDIVTLYRRTEGWIAGLYLASLSLTGRDDQSAFIASFSGSNLELAEYLTEDILSQQTEECRNFLLQTSVLERFCAPLCDELTDRDDSRTMLDTLERSNLFLTPIDNQQQWFRYHHLFASFLRDALERQYPGKATTLNHKAAHWFLGAGQPIPAIQHLFAAGLLDEAATCLAEHLDETVDSGRTRLLLRWLDRLPQEVRDRHANLELTYAWLLASSGRLKDAKHVAQHLRQQRGEDYAYVAEAMHCLHLGNSDEAEECYNVGVRLLEYLPIDDANLYVVLASCVAVNMVACGHYDEARAVLAQAFQRNVRINSSFLRFTFGLNEGILDLVQGRLSSALMRLQALHEASNAERPRNAILSMEILHGILLYESGLLTAAQTRLERSLPFAKQVSSPDNLIASHVLMARLVLEQGNRGDWLRYLLELEQIGQLANSPRIQCSAWLERARLAILENRLEAAEEALRAADTFADWDRPGLLKFANDVDTPSIARQRLRIAQGHFSEALAALQELLEEARRGRQHRREIKLGILLAMALEGQGQHADAQRALDAALRQAAPEGMLQTFVEEGARMAPLFERWTLSSSRNERSQDIDEIFIYQLRQRLGLTAPANAAAAAQVAPSQLTEREFQILRLLAAGHRNRNIAEKVFLSEFTVKSHLQKIYAKLDVRGRTEALAIARTRGWLD